MSIEHVDTVVIGGGQAGLALGYHLARGRRDFLILEAHDRVGDSWRQRWDSLKLFTPARIDGLPGSTYPAPPWSYPTRDEFADYLEAYAKDNELPVRTDTRVTRLLHNGVRYLVQTSTGVIEADNVVLAAGFDTLPSIPALASDLDPGIRQIAAADYRNPGQLLEGDVLVVGAGNSGADIALEVARGHQTYLAGRHPGEIPWRIESKATRPLSLVIFFAFTHVLNLATPVGRKLRPQMLAHSGPLIRVKSADLEAAGVERVPRVVDTLEGRPMLEGGRTLNVSTIIWCTGFHPDASWIDLPGLQGEEVDQDRGVVAGHPGLYVLGRLFQYSLASSMIHGVGNDAALIARHLARTRPVTTRAASPTV